MLATITILTFMAVMAMFAWVVWPKDSRRPPVGGKQPPGVKPVRMGPAQPLPERTSGQRSAPNARPMVMGPAQPLEVQTYRPVGVHLIVEYGADELILRVDSGNLIITGPEGRCQALRQGDGYHLPITFQITET